MLLNGKHNTLIYTDIISSFIFLQLVLINTSAPLLSVLFCFLFFRCTSLFSSCLMHISNSVSFFLPFFFLLFALLFALGAFSLIFFFIPSTVFFLAEIANCFRYIDGKDNSVKNKKCIRDGAHFQSYLEGEKAMGGIFSAVWETRPSWVDRSGLYQQGIATFPRNTTPLTMGIHFSN